MRQSRRPLYEGYFADPFVLAVDGGFVAFGTGTGDERGVFEMLGSSDLRSWQSHGSALHPIDAEFGGDYWAPEVAERDGTYWMYYSVGHGDARHMLRVAASEDPLGPYRDCGVTLSGDELFAIDPHPFRDDDGTWYLFFARDVLEATRPGTHLAVVELASATSTKGEAVPVLEPDHDWQIYQLGRELYGAVYDWHTLEGPSVVRREGRYWMTYSGGAWTGQGYGVSWAVADHPLGPWSHAPTGIPPLLSTDHTSGMVGPGHNSIVTSGDADVLVFHAWDPALTARRMFANQVRFGADGPTLGPPVEPA